MLSVTMTLSPQLPEYPQQHNDYNNDFVPFSVEHLKPPSAGLVALLVTKALPSTSTVFNDTAEV
jgi:hypothetical protein